jgi:hypothetical protein
MDGGRHMVEMSWTHIPKTSKKIETSAHFLGSGFQPTESVSGGCPFLQYFIAIM